MTNPKVREDILKSFSIYELYKDSCVADADFALEEPLKECTDVKKKISKETCTGDGASRKCETVTEERTVKECVIVKEPCPADVKYILKNKVGVEDEICANPPKGEDTAERLIPPRCKEIPDVKETLSLCSSYKGEKVTECYKDGIKSVGSLFNQILVLKRSLNFQSEFNKRALFYDFGVVKPTRPFISTGGALLIGPDGVGGDFQLSGGAMFEPVKLLELGVEGFYRYTGGAGQSRNALGLDLTIGYRGPWFSAAAGMEMSTSFGDFQMAPVIKLAIQKYELPEFSLKIIPEFDVSQSPDKYVGVHVLGALTFYFDGFMGLF